MSPTAAAPWLAPHAAGARPPDRPPSGSGDPRLPAILTVCVGLAAVLIVVWTMLTGSYDQFAAVLIAGILILATVPLARHAARLEGWPALTWVVMGGMGFRLAGAVARYAVSYGVYGGVADASTYTTVASNSYHDFRRLHFFAPNTGVFHGLVPWLDTVLYAIAGPTELGAFFLFAWISFIGAYLFYRAFRIAFPEGDGRRYAVLVFFLPSLLFWPSSLGKEAWMVFAIGLASYGLARAFAGRLGGYLAIMAGIGAMLLVRPHLALIFLPAAVVSFVLRRPTPGRRRPIGRLVGVAVLIVSSLVVVAKAQSYFGITNLDVQTVTKQLATTRQQTAIGNSAFHPPNAQSPLGYPQAVATVLFRPFPFEAHSITVGVASLEGLLMIGLTVTAWRRLRLIPLAIWRNPYVLFALVYAALFVLAFANFSNFGILARERVQMLPLFLVLLSIPATAAELLPVASPDGTESRRRPRSPGESDRKLRTYGEPRRIRQIPAPHAVPRFEPTRRRAAPSHPIHLPAPGWAAARPVLRAGSFRALDYRFDVEVTDGEGATELRADIGWLLGDLARAVPGDHRYRLTGADGERGRLVLLERDDGVLWDPMSPADALVRMVGDINIRAAASRPDHLVLHAAAVSLDGVGLLLPGPSGAGKTMTAAALVSAGFAYLTDEAVAIDPDALHIEPYPKPLSLRSGWRPILHGGVSDPVEPDAEELVRSSDLRPQSTGRRSPARWLLFPRYVPGATTALTPMSRAQALVEVANNSFNFTDHGGEWLDFLGRLVMGCWCGRLTTGDLDDAVALVFRLVRTQGGAHP